MLRLGERISSAVILAFSLGGCGMVVPDIKEIWDGPRGTEQIEFEVKKKVYCELKDAVIAAQDIPFYSENRVTGRKKQIPILPDNWGAQVTDTENDNENDPIKRLMAAMSTETAEQRGITTRLRAKFISGDREIELAKAFDILINEAIRPRDVSLPPSLDNRSPARGLALIGATGVGKSTSLRRLLMQHPAFVGYQDPASQAPLLYFSAPSPCTIVQLGRKLLIASGYPLERDLPAHRLFELAAKRLNAHGKIVLVIEEFQHVVHNVHPRDQQMVADILKSLMEVERITVVISGIETLKPFLALDPQLDRRMTKVFFDKLEPADFERLTDIMHAYVDEAGLDVAYTDAEALVPRLAHASLGAFGLAIENIIAAIALCRQRGDGTLICPVPYQTNRPI